MLHHHLKMAFRNLRKYKTQNIISIIGLAVGFTCFAFSALWIRYEMSYDNFHPKADRIYRVNSAINKWNPVVTPAAEDVQHRTPYPLANWLLTNIPEVADAGNSRPEYLIGHFYPDIDIFYVNDGFARIFELPIPDDFFIPGHTDRPAAVKNNLHLDAEAFKEEQGYDIMATIPAWPANTNYKFDVVVPTIVRWPGVDKTWGQSQNTYILVHKGVDIEALKKKLDKVDIPEWRRDIPVSLILTPLTQLRYKDPTGLIRSDVKFNHIRIFAVAGLLVILCSLFNHLTLFVTRAHMRLRELALRKVNGASDWQIAATLYTDFLLVIIMSLIAGFILMTLLLPTFKEYASIGSSNGSIYGELFLYAVLLVVGGFFAGAIPVLFFRKQVLNESIKSSGNPGSKNTFRKAGLLAQLMISLGMMFCAAVFIKQVRFLNHQPDLLVNQKNVGFVRAPACCRPVRPHWIEHFLQIPGMVDAIPMGGVWEFVYNTLTTSPIDFVDRYGNAATVHLVTRREDPRFFEFMGMNIIQGTTYPRERRNSVVESWFVINETAMREAGDHLSNSPYFMGVVRDIQITPTDKVLPTRYLYPNLGANQTVSDNLDFFAVAYKYEEGMRQQVHDAIVRFYQNEFPLQENVDFFVEFDYTEDLYEMHFKSERALLAILSTMTLACILIAVFGVYSLTSLTCQQRKKEIAIRKVHGAEVLDIMNIFFKEYLILLALAALVAFPAGYLIMKRWLEGYVKQTSMDAWLYVAIFLMVFVVIVFSIVSMVWKAANQNPAEVVKNDC